MNNNFTLLPTVLCIVATCQHVLVTTSSTNRRYLQDVANNENVDLNVGRNGVEAAAAKGKNSKKKKGAAAAAANVAENSILFAAYGACQKMVASSVAGGCRVRDSGLCP